MHAVKNWSTHCEEVINTHHAKKSAMTATSLNNKLSQTEESLE